MKKTDHIETVIAAQTAMIRYYGEVAKASLTMDNPLSEDTILTAFGITEPPPHLRDDQDGPTIDEVHTVWEYVIGQLESNLAAVKGS